MKCEVRRKKFKQLVKDKREKPVVTENASRSNQSHVISYAQKTAGAFQDMSEKNMTAIYASIAYAKMYNDEYPGTFKRNVEQMFKLNNLPLIQFPDCPYTTPFDKPQSDPNPAHPCALGASGKSNHEEQHRGRSHSRRDPNRKEKKTSHSLSRTEDSQARPGTSGTGGSGRGEQQKNRSQSRRRDSGKRKASPQPQPPAKARNASKERITEAMPTAMELGLTMLKCSTKNYPTYMNQETMTSMLNSGELKYRFTNSNYTNLYVHNALQLKQIKVPNSSFTTMEEEAFNVFESGHDIHGSTEEQKKRQDHRDSKKGKSKQ